MAESTASGGPIALACALVASALTAQADSRAASLEEFTTGDGSRFILLPSGGAPVVHWVMLTPAGTLEDPTGFEGLSHAVARAAVVGTSFNSSRDSGTEWQLLGQQDLLEREWDSILARGETAPDSFLLELQTARAAAAALSDPIAWERQLRQAPALGTRLEQIPEASLLHITTSLPGLTRVAELLVERREGPVLRGIHREFRMVRAERERGRTSDVRTQLRREVLGLSFLGHPFARAVSPDEPRPLQRSRALEVLRRTQHPARTLHVLTGGFETAAVRELLMAVFSDTALPPAAPEFQPPPRDAVVERRSTVPGERGLRQAVAVGLRIPDDTTPETLAVVLYWLTQDVGAELVQRLRLAGHPEAIISGTAPFPHRRSGLFLLEVEDVPRRRAAPELLASVESCLANILSNGGPSDQEVADAASRLQAARSWSRLGGSNLARELALACGVDGQSPAAALEPPTFDADEVRSMVHLLLAPGSRTVVQLDVER